MGDGSIFYAIGAVIGAVIDFTQQFIGRCVLRVQRAFYTKEQKRLQVLAGIRKESMNLEPV